jgi:CRP-like cAMP-binding protein
LIQTGQVKLVKVIGKIEKTIDILQPSDMFGEMAILENSPRSATAIAVGITTLLEFNRQNFNILMQGNPQIAMKLLKTFATRIYDQKKWLSILTIRDPQAKIASAIMMLDELQPGEKPDNRREFPISLDDLAHWAGLSVHKTQEALTPFIAQHLMELYSDKILIKNINLISRFIPVNRR